MMIIIYHLYLIHKEFYLLPKRVNFLFLVRNVVCERSGRWPLWCLLLSAKENGFSLVIRFPELDDFMEENDEENKEEAFGDSLLELFRLLFDSVSETLFLILFVSVIYTLI